MEVIVKDEALRKAAEAGNDEFLKVIISAIHAAIGGDLTGDNMKLLNSEQITLLGYEALHEEVMDGGFIQLIHNGWGGFIFRNPFDRVARDWGLPELCSIIRRVHKLYFKYKDKLERDCTDEQFMALFEQYPEFDTFDDEFVEREEDFTNQIAQYVDKHLDNFVKVEP